MLVAELIRSCSHAKVAEAAIHSIGPDLAHEVRVLAKQRGLDAGAYAAESVLVFAGSARPHDWNSLAERLKGVDMPILVGLHFILERRITEELRRSDCAFEAAAHRLPAFEPLSEGCRA